MPEQSDHSEIREALEKLPEGTKENAAWEKLGAGKIPRHEFRELWLEVRVPTKTEQEKKEVNNTKPKKKADK